MAGDWMIGVSKLLSRVLLLFEEQEGSGDVLQTLQASSESLRSRLAVALASEKATKLSSQASNFAQIGWNRRERLIGTLKRQQGLPLVLFKGNATRSQRLGAGQLLEVLDSPSDHQVNSEAILPHCAIAELAILNTTDTFERAMILLNAPTLVIPVNFFKCLLVVVYFKRGQQHPLDGLFGINLSNVDGPSMNRSQRRVSLGRAQLNGRKAYFEHTTACCSILFSVHIKLMFSRHRLALHIAPQVSVATLEAAVLLGADQQFGMERIFLRQQKQLIDIGLAISDTDHGDGAAQLALQASGSLETLKPLVALFLFNRSLVTLGPLTELLGIARPDLNIDQAHRRARSAIGHGVVHQNALGTIDTFINGSEPFHVRVSVIVKAGGVLDRQHDLHVRAGDSLHRGVIVRRKDSLHRHSVVPEQSISGFGLGAALTRLRYIGLRLCVEIARHHQQSLAVAPIAQAHPAKLLFCPIPRRLGCFAQTPRRTARRTRLLAQTLLPVRLQRVDIDVFDWLFLSMLSILTPPTASLSDMNPIGRTVRGGGKTFGLNIGLQQQRLITIRLGPILGQAFLRQRQNFGSEVFYPHAARNDKTRVGNHLGQMTLTGRVTPTNPAIARFQIKGRRTEGQRSQPSLITTDQVAQLRSTQRSIPQVVMGRYQLLPLQVQSAIFRTDQHQLKPPKLFERVYQLRRDIQARPSQARLPRAYRAQRRWQLDQSAFSQTTQRYPTVQRLYSPILAAPVQPMANSTR